MCLERESGHVRGVGRHRRREKIPRRLPAKWGARRGAPSHTRDHDLSRNQELDAQPTESHRRPSPDRILIKSVIQKVTSKTTLKKPVTSKATLKKNDHIQFCFLSIIY